MKHETRNEKERSQIGRYLEQKAAGDVGLCETTSYSPIGPTGAQMSVDLGGGRTLQGITAGATAHAPGTSLVRGRARGGAMTHGLATAPRTLQPNAPSQEFTYDPTGELLL